MNYVCGLCVERNQSLKVQKKETRRKRKNWPVYQSTVYSTILLHCSNHLNILPESLSRSGMEVKSDPLGGATGLDSEDDVDELSGIFERVFEVEESSSFAATDT